MTLGSISGLYDPKVEDGFEVSCKDEKFYGDQVIISTGRSGSKSMQEVCSHLGIKTKSNRVDIGVRVEYRQPFLSILLMRCMRARLFIVPANIRIRCVLFV